MLKITIVDGRSERKLMVEGKLASPWVSELESAWNQTRKAGRRWRVVVDLSGTTCIDQSGKATLIAMIGEGARLTAKGVYSEYIAEELMNKARDVRAARNRKHTGVRAIDSSSATQSSEESQRSPCKETH